MECEDISGGVLFTSSCNKVVIGKIPAKATGERLELLQMAFLRIFPEIRKDWWCKGDIKFICGDSEKATVTRRLLCEYIDPLARLQSAEDIPKFWETFERELYSKHLSLLGLGGLFNITGNFCRRFCKLTIWNE